MSDTTLDDTNEVAVVAASEQLDAPLRLPPVLPPQQDNQVWATHMPPHRPHLPWRRITYNALILWAITRVIYIVFTYLATGLPQAQTSKGSGFLALWQRFDTNWYISIAQTGYAEPQQLAFFPLYPALIKLFSYPFGGNYLLAALVVGNLGTLAALIGLGALVAWEERDDANATRAMILLLAFPFAFFLAAAYTEGLFIAIASFCLLFARQGRWGWATLFAFLAGATRPTGVILILPLAWEWAQQNGLLDGALWRGLLQTRNLRVLKPLFPRALRALRSSWAGLASLVMVPLFFLFFMALAGLLFGHPLLVINVHRDYWGLTSAPVWTTFIREFGNLPIVPYASYTQVIMILDLATIAAVAVATILLWRSLPFMYNLYMLCLLYLAVAQPSATNLQVLQSPGRFLLPAIPILIGLSGKLERRPALAGALVVMGCVLQGYIALRFLTGVLVE